MAPWPRPGALLHQRPLSLARYSPLPHGAGIAPERTAARKTLSCRNGSVPSQGRCCRQWAETEFFDVPAHKDIDTQMVVDLRRMLSGTGYGPVVEEVEAKGRED